MSAPVIPLHPEPPYHREVREYLEYCERIAGEFQADGAWLDPQYHPTASGACRLIFHGGDKAEAAKIRAAYDAVTNGSNKGGNDGD